MSIPIRLGATGLFCGRRYMATAVYRDGRIILRPTGAAKTSYVIGEKVRIVERDSLGKKTESEGVIVSLEPVRASVDGRLVERSRLRKWKHG